MTLKRMDASIDELWNRIYRRPGSQQGTLHFTRAELEQWAVLFEPPIPEERD